MHIEVKNLPLLNLKFTQFKATIEGSVICLGDKMNLFFILKIFFD